MVRQRPALGTPFGTDGPWLSAILDVLGDLHDLIDERFPKADAGGGVVPVREPAPDRPPAKSVPASEPAPDGPPDVEDGRPGPVEVSEPRRVLPDPPPRAGRGSSLDAWQSFADLAEVRYPADGKRDDVIAACVKAGVIGAE